MLALIMIYVFILFLATVYLLHGREMVIFIINTIQEDMREELHGFKEYFKNIFKKLCNFI